MKKPKIVYKYDRGRALELLMDKSAYSDWDKFEADILTTESFIKSAFDDFEGYNSSDPIDFAFCIPTRASRFSDDYWEEVYDFVPALRHLEINYRFAILAHMPPLRIVQYGETDEHSHGAVIFVPIFSDMLKDYRSKISLRREVRKRINDAAKLAHEKYGAEYIGLGATLPKLTNFGRAIKTRAITTTGHAGTVWLMKETYKNVINDYFKSKDSLKIGFIGAGSIGLSTLETIASKSPQHSYQIFDIRDNMNQAAKTKLSGHGIDLKISASNRSLIEECDVILSAVTTKIDIEDIDLTGKVLIDDSQPGQFVRNEVENAGGVLVWVVGHDGSASKFATRRGGYSYGVHGLGHENDLWGCEAEVAAIASVGRPDLAIEDHVTPEDVENIGKVFQEVGIGTANYQSFGKLNSE